MVTMNGGEKGSYLFCLTRSAPGPAADGIKEAFDGCLRFHTFKSITAVVETVSLDEFCGPNGEANMKELSWVVPRAVRHEKVIEWVMAHSPVIPANFGTIFSSMENLDRLLGRNEEVIEGFFEEIEDKAEWAVKGLLNQVHARERASSTVLEKKAAFLSSLSAGRRYFEEKKALSEADGLMGDWLKDALRTVHGEFAAHASGFREGRSLKGAQGEGDVKVVFNWAFLVQTSSLARFRDGVRRATDLREAEGLVFELSGPWPPYSFSPSLDME
jgi:hypothetical protein